jgi:membrane-bound metal-dependent hydrolase YbcI (DUF457 family)
LAAISTREVARLPFTPFHFGVGLAAKAALPRRFSLCFFVALQVVIDLESLYNLVKDRHPVHRFLHTFVGATLLAILAAALVFGVMVRWRARGTRIRLLVSLLANALFATWSHVVLDGIMHRDARPFWPMSDENPLLSLVGVGVLHLACVALGVFGLIGLAFKWSLRDDER